MRVRLPLTIATALLLAAPAVPAASAGPSDPAPAQRAVRTQLLLSFDNRESLRPGSIVRNTAGRGGGRVLVADGGRLRAVRGLEGRAALFPRACGGCGRALIEVPDRRRLDPGRTTFSFGAAVRVTPRRANRHSNIVQKGFFRQSGGQYKLQLDFGRPSCVIAGGAGRLIARAKVDIADRRWHRLSCHRRPRGIVLRVDGRIRAGATGRTGWIANQAPVRVGAHRVARGPNEQYHGRLDGVFVRTKR